jgi:DNA polymerase III sliding clamp (beta) subunit (PCNA family)
MKQSAFIAALKFASHAMAAKDIRYYLNGVCLELMGDSMILIGTDGHRMAWATLEDDNSGGLLEGKSNGPQFIIPAEHVKLLLTAFKGASTGYMEFEFKDDTITFRGGSATVPVRLVDGHYPDWRRVSRSAMAPVATEQIGFNGQYLADAGKACSALDDTRYGGVTMRLFGANEAIKVSPGSLPQGITEAACVVMPMRL